MGKIGDRGSRRCWIATGLVISGFFSAPAFAESDLERLVAEARTGNAWAQYELGDQYRWGFIVMPDNSRVEKNPELALKWLGEAAQQKYAAAEFSLGEVYYDGSLGKIDEPESVKWVKRFLEHKDNHRESIAQAAFMLGKMYYQQCDLYWLSLSCGKSREGKLVFQDYREAASWFRLASDAGNREAHYELASMLETGRGVPQDFAQAARLYQAAVDAGYTSARGPLGRVFVRMGDYVSAHMWFNLATLVSDPFAEKLRDEVAMSMTKAQIADAQKRASEWYARKQR